MHPACAPLAAVLAAALVSLTAAGADAQFVTSRFADGFNQPVFAAAPDLPNETRLFVVERDGRIQIVQNGVRVPGAFLDITSCTPPNCVDTRVEGGLLGLAFSPDYASDGEFYVYYTAGDPAVVNDQVSRISRFRVIGDPLTSNAADPASEEIVFSLPQPAAENHKGGTLAFSNGYLYLALGDGGFDSNSAQDDSSLLGKLLRFDVSLAVPTPEVVAKGLRNPFRFSFDPLTGDLYLGDVGAAAREEIDVVAAADLVGVAPGQPAPLNFGWDVEEGTICRGPSPASEPACGVPLPPTTEYDTTINMRAGVIGGVVYRGGRFPNLQGHYFFGDLFSDEYWSFEWDPALGIVGGVIDRSAPFAPVDGTIELLVAFGTDAQGEIYLVDLAGEVYQLPEPGGAALLATAIGVLWLGGGPRRGGARV